MRNANLIPIKMSDPPKFMMIQFNSLFLSGVDGSTYIFDPCPCQKIGNKFLQAVAMGCDKKIKKKMLIFNDLEKFSRLCRPKLPAQIFSCFDALCPRNPKVLTLLHCPYSTTCFSPNDYFVYIFMCYFIEPTHDWSGKKIVMWFRHRTPSPCFPCDTFSFKGLFHNSLESIEGLLRKS